MTKPLPLVGVLGGMGPLACVDFLYKLLNLHPVSRDQDQIPTLVWNVPQIPDRQKALAGLGPSPLPEMSEGIERLNAQGAKLIVIPCHTAHVWYDDLKAKSAAPILHIAEATLNALSPNVSTLGLIATQGTLEAKIYQNRFEPLGLKVLTPTAQEMSDYFVPGCYAVKQNALTQGGQWLQTCAQALLDRGAETLVLACTEVPIGLSAIKAPLLAQSLDPTEALAKATIAYWQRLKS